MPMFRSTAKETAEKMALLVAMAKTDFGGECAHWPCNKTAQGYGLLQVNKRLTLAHRASYCVRHQIAISSIRGLVVRHKCDNPICINPDHLELGTQADNVADMHARNRNGHGGAKGSKNAAAKIDEVKVARIKEMLSQKRTGVSIAKEFGISKSLVSHIKTGKHWRHV